MNQGAIEAWSALIGAIGVVFTAARSMRTSTRVKAEKDRADREALRAKAEAEGAAKMQPIIDRLTFERDEARRALLSERTEAQQAMTEKNRTLDAMTDDRNYYRKRAER